ncbi:MAG: prepilin-type N-terminal cleavage/methylation domain-containing protein [Pelagibacterales bacterium]|nr:prepilin-type N-terminal cleavage/methylation domain-containing protein [Pelagibacterales bacterium]
MTKSFLGSVIKKYIKKAFSLVELSIVIMVIVIIVLGVISGSILYDKFQLKVAQNQTTSSPVNSIKDLELWIETTLEKSVEQSDLEENDNKLSNWYDIKERTKKINLTQTVEESKPLFVSDALDSIPMISFDVNDDYLEFSGSALNNTADTIFVVEKRSSSKNNNYFIGDYSAETTSNCCSWFWNFNL